MAAGESVMERTSAADSRGAESVVPPFRNEPLVDFRLAENRRAMQRALEHVAQQLGREYENVIGGHRVRSKGKLRSINPSHPEQVVGVFQRAEPEDVPAVLEAAEKAFASWQHASAEERAGLLFRLAHALREKKFEWSAWLVYEVGKNWAEADADVAEAIDFAEFYAREALRLARSEPPVRLPGEQTELRYLPLGVGAVIPPWNFPLAIVVGMTTAAIVAGNTVVLKPSSQAMTIAAAMPWSAIQGRDLSPLPDRRPRDCRFTSWRRVRIPASAGSSAPSWRWAARTPFWWMPMRIWTPQWPA
jgi:1-pyrroline-5-carboxylate dehydrogenase